MAVAFGTSQVTTSADHGGAGGTDAVTLPASLASGDLIVITAICDADPGVTISVPSGYTAVDVTKTGQDGWPALRCFWKIAGASESNPSVTTTVTYVCWFVAMRFTGTHQTTPIGNVGNGTSTGNVAVLDAPDVTIQNDGSAAVLVCGAEGDASGTPTITVPAGTTSVAEREGVSVFPEGGVAYELRPTAGAYAPGNWTFNRGGETDNLDGVAQTFEIIPAPAAAGNTVFLLGA